jgi:predicted PurR-regulated permease PerM
MLPFGAWLAFTAAALILISGGGSGFGAAAIFIWGAIIMMAGDHFVWPTLVGDSARLSFLLAFVGIFGGLAAFGLRTVSGPCHHGGAADSVARVDLSTGP